MCWIQPPGTPSVGALAPRRLPRHRRRDLLQRRRAHLPGADRGAASVRRLELHPRLRRRGLAQALVRDDRHQRLAARGVPALLRQRDLRRRRHRGGVAVPAAHVPGEARPALPRAAEQGHRLRPRRAVQGRRRRRRLAAALPAVAACRSRRCRRPTRSSCPPAPPHGMEDGDYTKQVTFNDDVAGENIKFLLMCVIGLGETRLIDPITRAMECLRRLQQPAPQAGWGLQHLSADQNGRPAGAPAGARSYEPRALATHTTQTNVQQLFNYFRLTGDRKYLARVPEAIAWLEDTQAHARSMIAENPLLAGAHAPDLHRTRHQPAALRAPLRLEHLERRVLHRPRPPQHAEPLLGRPQHQHRRPADHLRPAERDERRRRRRDGGELAAEGDAGPGAAEVLLAARSRLPRPLHRRRDDQPGGRPKRPRRR